jgi:hypothetical protein
MSSQCFCNVALKEHRQGMTAITKKSGAEEVMIRMDNCKVHNSERQWKDSKNFGLLAWRMRHILPTFRLAISGSLAGARM